MEQYTYSKLGKYKDCPSWPCLLNLYAEYIIQNAVLDKSQAVLQIVGRNINNIRYADYTTIMAESKEVLKSLLMGVEEESEKVAWKSAVKKLRSWYEVP